MTVSERLRKEADRFAKIGLDSDVWGVEWAYRRVEVLLRNLAKEFEAHETAEPKASEWKPGDEVVTRRGTRLFLLKKDQIPGRWLCSRTKDGEQTSTEYESGPYAVRLVSAAEETPAYREMMRVVEDMRAGRISSTPPFLGSNPCLTSAAEDMRSVFKPMRDGFYLPPRDGSAKKAIDERLEALDEVGRKFEAHFGIKPMAQTRSFLAVLDGVGRWCRHSPQSRHAAIYLEPNSVRVVITTHPTLAMFETTFENPEAAETVMNILDHGIGMAADHPARRPEIRFPREPK